MKEIKSHTSLRGIAALLVAYYHLELGMPDGVKSSNQTMLVENSFIFVDLFFILSGFILAYVYSEAFIKTKGKEVYYKYFIARVSRIYPLHFATLFFMLLLTLYSSGLPSLLKKSDDIIQNIFLIHAWGLSERFIFNFPSWSVSVEFFAYLLFPLILMFTKHKKGLLFLCFISAVLYAYMYFILDTVHVDEHLSLIRGIPSFILGVILFNVKNVTSNLSNLSISIIQLISAFLILFVMHLDKNLFIALFIFPVLVIFLWEDRGLLAKLLSDEKLVYLGALSYSIYLLHVPIRNCMHYVFPKLNLPVTETLEPQIFIFTTLFLTIVCSSFTYHFFEKPCRNKLKIALSKIVFREN